jgi:hypothetical protein
MQGKIKALRRGLLIGINFSGCRLPPDGDSLAKSISFRKVDMGIRCFS